MIDTFYWQQKTVLDPWDIKLLKSEIAQAEADEQSAKRITEILKNILQTEESNSDGGICVHDRSLVEGMEKPARIKQK
jgi:hypothetical protein